MIALVKNDDGEFLYSKIELLNLKFLMHFDI